MPDHTPNLFDMYLHSGYEELFSYYEYVELVSTDHLPIALGADSCSAANSGNSLTSSQRGYSDTLSLAI